ncbi:NADP-dependent oxidoreductase domain-containing protein [Clohesyomyces aquaticus]|uniref:NADP-dependent oxidoreductase domain-containing protein n=1 Tax=Clohesyomyces aquaticus TaxID=1231657 RepID=A0A1Y2A9Y8_9PLEO|nr:NADP-dependent oxidoreductase domain-containing protein [Clohesyomyces aquaticus]
MSVKAVFGGASLNPHGAFKDPEVVKEALEILQREGVTTLDTARLYPGSEETIGKAPGHDKFIIDTKVKGGFQPGSISKDKVLADAQDSLQLVNVDQLDILYIHAPDKTVPIEETLEAFNELYKKGVFKRFGLSNFSAEQVQEAYDVAKSKGYPLPAVYQGNYSPVARKLEDLLFPTLRKLGIAFYAYSPLAGGLLTKTKEDIAAGVGRFNENAVGGLYNRLYNKPEYLEALSEWNDIADAEGVSKAELAYRWVKHHSALKGDKGDGVIFGASNIKQLEQTAQTLKKGPLSEEAAKKIHQVWLKVEKVAPIDNFQ